MAGTVLSHASRASQAYHEAGHVLTAWMLEHADPLLKTTIVPRANGALGFAQYVPNDRNLHSRAELEDRLVVCAVGGAVWGRGCGCVSARVSMCVSVCMCVCLCAAVWGTVWGRGDVMCVRLCVNLLVSVRYGVGYCVGTR